MFDQITFQKIKTTLSQYPHARLIAVSKTKPSSDVLEALRCGQQDFGENYAQELKSKSNELQTVSPDHKIRWHFIGHLQSNKTKDVVGIADWIHSIDRLSLAQEINHQAQKKNHVQKGLLQVNISEQDSKFGVPIEEALQLLKDLNPLSHLQIEGFMMIGNQSGSADERQTEFKLLKSLLDESNAKSAYKTPLVELSMGMSGDFEDALACGATMIRVGQTLFGERQKQ